VDRLQRLFPKFDSGEDAAWIGVGLGDEAIDGSLEVGDRSEDVALEASASRFGEEA